MFKDRLIYKYRFDSWRQVKLKGSPVSYIHIHIFRVVKPKGCKWREKGRRFLNKYKTTVFTTKTNPKRLQRKTNFYTLPLPILGRARWSAADPPRPLAPNPLPLRKRPGTPNVSMFSFFSSAQVLLQTNDTTQRAAGVDPGVDPALGSGRATWV